MIDMVLVEQDQALRSGHAQASAAQKLTNSRSTIKYLYDESNRWVDGI